MTRRVGHANVSVVGGLYTFASVIALPLGGGPDCNIVTGGVTSSGFNYSDDTSCALTSIGDVQGRTPPVLGALADNGGDTFTREPAVPGPLVDKIPSPLCAAGMGIVVDQRGFPRPETGGSLCDIGAVEVQQGPPLTPLTPLTPGGPASGLVTVTPRFTG